MTFLSPFFLWMLPLISIPTLIHLWNKYRVKEIEFSTIKFLKIMESKSIKKVKLIELLLLILRTLIILLIVLFISRPVLRGEFSNWVYNPQSTLTAIIIDDSFSMNGIRSKDETSKIIHEKIDEITKTLLKKQTVVFGSLNKGIEFYGLYEEFLDFNTNIVCSDLNLNLDKIIKQLNDTLNHEIINKEIYLITDLQKSSININNKNSNVFESWNSFIIDVGFPNENLAIKSLKINSEIILPNESFEIQVTVVNNGTTSQFQRMVVLNVDGLDVGQQLISLDPQQEEKVKFNTALPSTGKFKISAKLDSDDNIKDNYWYKSLNIPDHLKIGMFSKFPEDMLYLNHTISAINNESKIFTILDYEINQIQNINLNQFDVLFISGTLRENDWGKVEQFVENGKHAMVFPASKDIKFNYFSNSLSLIKLENDNYILPHSNISQLKHNSSIEKLLNNKTISPKFFKYYTLENFNESLINLENNSSIWHRKKYDNGFVDILGFGLSTEWTNIPLLAGFIPFLHNWIYSGETITSNPELFTGMQLGQKINNNSQKNEIINPQLENFILSVDSFGSLTDYTFEAVGWYSLLLNNNENIVYGVNVPPLELENKIIEDLQLKEIFNNFRIINSSEELGTEIKAAKIGTEIGTQLLIIIFLLLIFEMFIAQLKPNQGKNN